MTDKYIIFLVDDDDVFLKLLKESLSYEQDYELHLFNSGENCINHMHLNPDVIVLDYLLNSKNPDAKNGLDILKQIKEINTDTQVVILSAQEDANLVYEFVRENVTNYICKDADTFDKVKKAISDIIKM